MSPLLRIENVTVCAGGRTLLAVDELAVRPDEILAVLGPTGAGKSTLLRVLGGLEPPASGVVRFGGSEARPPWPLALRRRVSMAFQAPLLFRGTVFDNVAYGLRLRRSPRARIRAEVGRILERFGIAALADRQAHTLSGGEAQRASLARAVVVRPDLLLLDEPLGSLDAVTRERLQAELAQIVRALGLACVHVTHDQAEARRLGDRIALLDEGRLLQTGPPDELFYRPRSLRVARSLGTQNLWPGRVLAARPGGRSVVAVAGDRTLLGADPVGRADRSVVACLRAEDVRLRPAAEGAAAERAGEDGADGVNALEGVVVERVPIGPTYAVTVDCGLPVVALLARRAAADLGAEVGRRLAVSFAPAAVQLVDAER